MTCSISVQIYKNYEGQQVFVSRVPTELVNSVPRLQKFSSSFGLTISTFVNSISSSILLTRASGTCHQTRSPNQRPVVHDPTERCRPNRKSKDETMKHELKEQTSRSIGRTQDRKSKELKWQYEQHIRATKTIVSIEIQ
jgi:hypothetical protein